MGTRDKYCMCFLNATLIQYISAVQYDTKHRRLYFTTALEATSPPNIWDEFCADI